MVDLPEHEEDVVFPVATQYLHLENLLLAFEIHSLLYRVPYLLYQLADVQPQHSAAQLFALSAMQPALLPAP